MVPRQSPRTAAAVRSHARLSAGARWPSSLRGPLLSMVLLLLCLILLPSGPGVHAGPPIGGAATAPAGPALRAQLDAGLRRWQETKGGPSRATVLLRLRQDTDLTAYAASVHRFRWPAGERMALVELRRDDLAALARNPAVAAISGADPRLPASEQRGSDRPDGWTVGPTIDADTVARAHSAAPWTEGKSAGPASRGGSPSRDRHRKPSQPLGPAALDGWFDVADGHAAREAWALGFRGQGVRVAVIDDAVDFVHPDLQGTWALLPPGHPYAGWPQVFDPEVGMLAASDRLALAEDPQSVPSRRKAIGGLVELYQQDQVQPVAGADTQSACFRPLQYVDDAKPRELAPASCTYKVPAGSKSGRVRFGHHPDPTLMVIGAGEDRVGEWAGILLVDAQRAGVYDTVYVDINNNRDFSDEKPVTQASPLSWRDLSAPADGLPDLAGGLLYWISDGESPFPGSWVWGLEDEVPAAGHVIGLHWVQGSHGTLCGSNIASQGRLGVPSGRRLAFRDLPGDGRPPQVNPGMAPEARLVSIGDVYVGGDALFQAAWRYAVFGHSKDRTDDDLQVVSNSYGWSGVDNDRWDPDSRLIDHYVRRFSPHTLFLTATGNGGPGYGTLTPPSPATGLDIAASTQMGSTGIDSITETGQIPFGDLIPFSNRGPGASGEHGPDLAADGADAAGALPINQVQDGASALATWGGTSRSTPVAAGAAALMVQAFRQVNGRWPTWDEAGALLMGGARFGGYDVFTAGSGVLDAGDSVRAAAGLGGVYALPPSWSAGDYGGRSRPAFANLVAAGRAATVSLTLRNPSDRPVTLRLSGARQELLGSTPQAYTADRRMEDGSGGELPDHLLPIDRGLIPDGTELMVVRGSYPIAQFAPFGDYRDLNVWGLRVYQHRDINGNGRLWSDRDGNGTVTSRLLSDAYLRLGREAAIDAIGAASLPDGGLAARLAWFGPSCPGLNGEPAQPVQDPTGAIALIPDGDCDDVTMLARLSEAGAVGAVVIAEAEAPLRNLDLDDDALPYLMVRAAAGNIVRDRLLAGEQLQVNLRARTERRGLDGQPLVDFEHSEMEPFEFIRMSEEYSPRNSWEVGIHHPLQRWSDGLYLGLAHTGPSAAVTETQFSLRLDYLAYRPWPALTLSRDSITLPARGEASVTAALSLDPASPPGLYQGAIFGDYERGPGDLPVNGPGGYERSERRLVIPVSAAVPVPYDWSGSRGVGAAEIGPDAAELAPVAGYANDRMRGAINWGWRAESGDWRFFFLDLPAAPTGGQLLTRLVWPDRGAERSDIDTRIFGPAADRFPDGDTPVGGEGSQAAGDPAWYGPHTLHRVGASPYLVNGSFWPFQTSSARGEDWVAAPAAAGLHLLALQNVRYDGAAIEQPFRLEVSSARLSPSRIELYGSACESLSVSPEINLGRVSVASFGLAGPPSLERDLGVSQDDPNDPGSASFTRTLTVNLPAAYLGLTIAGRASDDLDLYLRHDADGDGLFTEEETVASSTSASASESVRLDHPVAKGQYLVMVHGYQVTGGRAGFDLQTDLLAGADLKAEGGDAPLGAGQTRQVTVCPPDRLPESIDEARGLLLVGPEAAPSLLQVPIAWRRRRPALLLPLQLRTEALP